VPFADVRKCRWRAGEAPSSIPESSKSILEIDEIAIFF